METDKGIERTTTGTRSREEAAHPSIPSSASRYPGSSRGTVAGPRFWAPAKGSAYAYKTLSCPLDNDDLMANRAAIEGLFAQYRTAITEYIRYVSLKGADRAAIGPSDHEAVRALTPGLLARVRSAAMNRAIEMWRSREEIERRGMCVHDPGTGHGPDDRRNYMDAIRLDARIYRLEPGRPVRAGNAIVRPLWASIPTPMGRVALRLGDDGYQVPILLNIIDGKDRAAIRSAELVRRGSGQDQGLYLDIRLSRPIPEEHRTLDAFVHHLATDPSIKVIPIGVDIGIVNTAVAVAPGKGRKGVRFFKGRAERERKRKMADLIRRLMERGTGKAEEDAQATRRKEERRNKAHLHEVSRGIVELAMSVADRNRGEVPVIVLEDLRFEDIVRRPARGREDRGGEEGIARTPSVRMRKDVASELRSWAYGQLRDLIAGKAAWEGIPTILVLPHGSSMECPRCGKGDVVRRRDVHRLVCPDCGYRANDDYCAALLLAKHFIEDLEDMADKTAKPANPSSCIQRYRDFHEPAAAFDRDGRGGVETPRSPQGEAGKASS